MTLAELEKKVALLEEKVKALEDIQQIDRLQKIYGYYLDNNMMDKVIDLFSDDAESVEIGDRGLFRGKEGVRRFFWEYLGAGRQAARPGHDGHPYAASGCGGC